MPFSKKVILLLLLCWLGGAPASLAQSAEPGLQRRHSLRAGCGLVPAQLMGEFIGNAFAAFLSFNNRWEKTGGTHPNTSLNLEYSYDLSRRWQLGMTGTYTGWRTTYVENDASGPVPDERLVKTRSWGIMPKVAFNWINNERCQLYTSYAMGWNLMRRRENITGMPEEKKRSSTGAFQLNIIGVNFSGKGRIGGFLETGFGWAGLVNSGVVVKL